MQPIGEGRREPLTRLPVLVLDAQATASDPARGALVEVGWLGFRADEPCEPAAAEVTTHLVAPPRGAELPPAMARITGLRTADWVRGIVPALAWERLFRAAERVRSPPVPVVIHFARYEEPFLRVLHRCHGAGPFPLDLVCTHAIACRLFPELPRRSLRALAGYFGAAVPPLRRSADHVVATAFVWRHLVSALAEEGVAGLAELRDWLSRPARRAARRFPLSPDRRRELPDRPGVYRLLRASGAVLYVGKAGSLRQRVRGHFHARPGDERALEMLTQARDVSWCETETALEAALLEADEIKRLAPPFNVALSAAGRALWFATADLSDPRQQPDPEHSVGPLASPDPVEALVAVRALVAAGAPRRTSLVVRGRALGVAPAYAPGPGSFAAGLERFAREHGCVGNPRDLLRLGARLWERRRAARPDETDRAEAPREPRRPSWDADRVSRALEETVLRAAHAVRRAGWLVRLGECSLAWAEPGMEGLRLLVIREGAVITRACVAHGTSLPVPPGYKRTAAERRAAFDVATFDRLRVLTTELRRVAATAPSVELRLGRCARLSRRRLQAVLRWV